MSVKDDSGTSFSHLPSQQEIQQVVQGQASEVKIKSGANGKRMLNLRVFEPVTAISIDIEPLATFVPKS